MLRKIFKWCFRILLFIIVFVNLVIICTGNFYIYRAIYYTYLHGQSGPDIFDKDYFYSREIPGAASQPWALAADYNKKDIPAGQEKELEKLGTTSFLVFRNDSLVFEKYYEGFGEKEVSNSFSMAKSVVGLLIGAALHEGKINSIDDPVSKYLPEYSQGNRSKITLRHLLTMSSDMQWGESGANPFSHNAWAYYTTDLNGVMQTVEYGTDPGKVFDYKSGSTQVLGMVLQQVTGKSLSAYASEKLWTKMGAEAPAYWSLDHENGVEKAYCCIYATSRDFARLGKLMLHNGKWNNEQLIDSAYIAWSIRPADLLTTDGKKNDRYGLTWWMTDLDGHHVFYARGIKGQYIICIPGENIMVIRTGHKRGEKTSDDLPAEVVNYIRTGLSFKKGVN